MNRKKALAASLTLALLLPATAQAHRAWIEPSATVLSADDGWVTFNAAISNELFHANYYPLRLDGVQVLGPNGKPVELENAQTGPLRSTFDLQLTQPGTYKVFTAHNGLQATWTDEQGERQRWPGRGETPPPSEFDKAVPKDAKDLQVSQSSRRLETFVTAGAPSNKVFKLSNQGLELQPVTHPNDLYAGEEAEFRLLIDGEPAAGAEVVVLPGGMRYRNRQQEMQLTADDKGVVRVKWPEAGVYWLGAEYSDDKAQPPASRRQGQYAATFEVLPQ